LPALVAGTLGRDIAIRTDLAPSLWPAFVDPGQVEAALLNLVFNARDAMPGGGTLTLATTNLLLPDDLPAGPSLAPGAYVAVRVTDTGVGMAPEVLARVFEPFFTTKPAGSASGLGLSQVHGVALQSGGDVRIDSRRDSGTPDSGTTVTLLLPRATLRAETGQRAAPPPGLRILVADDDDAVRRMTGEILAERGHRPTLAADATQALSILEKDLADTGGSFDVLLSDYVMPGTNGVALILMAQALQPRMHALLVTGHAELDPDDPLRPQDILRKPFTIAALEERLALIRAEAAPPAPQPAA
jgi:CheY-like chemotaxis protein